MNELWENEWKLLVVLITCDTNYNYNFSYNITVYHKTIITKMALTILYGINKIQFYQLLTAMTSTNNKNNNNNNLRKLIQGSKSKKRRIEHIQRSWHWSRASDPNAGRFAEQELREDRVIPGTALGKHTYGRTHALFLFLFLFLSIYLSTSLSYTHTK